MEKILHFGAYKSIFPEVRRDFFTKNLRTDFFVEKIGFPGQIPSLVHIIHVILNVDESVIYGIFQQITHKIISKQAIFIFTKCDTCIEISNLL